MAEPRTGHPNNDQDPPAAETVSAIPDANPGSASDAGGDSGSGVGPEMSPGESGREMPTPQPRSLVCPFCGEITRSMRRCDVCGGRFDPLSRQATQNAMGPWWVRGVGSVRGPGCAYSIVRSLVARGVVKRDSVVRGPTTRQFWMLAAKTPGVAHLLGSCHSCGTAAAPDASVCDACGAVFEVEADRQWLGLGPVRDLPGQQQANEGSAGAHAIDGAGRAGGAVVGHRPVQFGQPSAVEASAELPLPSDGSARAPAVLAAASVALVLGLVAGAGLMWYSTRASGSGDGPSPGATANVGEPATGPGRGAADALVVDGGSNEASPGAVAAWEALAEAAGSDEAPKGEPGDASGPSDVAAATERAEEAASARQAAIEQIESLISLGTWAALTEAEASLAEEPLIESSDRERLASIIRERLAELAMRELP